jgi:hypothetical protein
MGPAIGAVLRHPGLWPTALRQAARLVPTGWWRRAPFLPLPPRDYLEFRMVTQYGSNSRRADPDDVVNYLRWCRDWEHAGA